MKERITVKNDFLTDGNILRFIYAADWDNNTAANNITSFVNDIEYLNKEKLPGSQIKLINNEFVCYIFGRDCNSYPNIYINLNEYLIEHIEEALGILKYFIILAIDNCMVEYYCEKFNIVIQYLEDGISFDNIKIFFNKINLLLNNYFPYFTNKIVFLNLLNYNINKEFIDNCFSKNDVTFVNNVDTLDSLIPKSQRSEGLGGNLIIPETSWPPQKTFEKNLFINEDILTKRNIKMFKIIGNHDHLGLNYNYNNSEVTKSLLSKANVSKYSEKNNSIMNQSKFENRFLKTNNSNSKISFSNNNTILNSSKNKYSNNNKSINSKDNSVIRDNISFNKGNKILNNNYKYNEDVEGDFEDNKKIVVNNSINTSKNTAYEQRFKKNVEEDFDHGLSSIYNKSEVNYFGNNKYYPKVFNNDYKKYTMGRGKKQQLSNFEIEKNKKTNELSIWEILGCTSRD